jgi:16S rRNA processing protein RimM
VTDGDRWIALAEVARAHGVRGEVRLRLYNTESDVLLGADEVLVRLPGGEEHEVSVDGARRAGDAILMKLHSVDDRDRAEELRGASILVRRSALPPLEEGEHYDCDLEGLEVLVGDDGAREPLGRVAAVRHYPTMDVIFVPTDGKHGWEIPLTDAYVVAVQVSEGRILVSSLEGLEPG